MNQAINNPMRGIRAMALRAKGTPHRSAFGLFFKGVTYIRATRASITSTLEPIVAEVVSYCLPGERLLFPQIIGGISVIAAITLLQAEKG
jgi:drug/metabolite transporter (DMT)-like permease